MSNISDVIEEFIKETIGQEDTINLSRNELAQYFNCAPSQINYVLSTRFTVGRGFYVESKRGGGGYIKVVKLTPSNSYLNDLITNQIKNEIDYFSAVQILDNLLDNNFIDEFDQNLLKSAINKKALTSPIKNEDYLRANILKNVLVEIQKRRK